MSSTRARKSPRKEPSRHELVEAVLAARWEVFESLQARLSVRDPNLPLAQSISHLADLSKGKVEAQTALASVARALGTSGADPNLRAIMLSAAIQALVMTNDLDSARARQDELIVALEHIPDPDVRAYVMGCGQAQLRGAVDGPEAAIGVIDQGLALCRPFTEVWATLKRARAHNQILLERIEGAVTDLDDLAARQPADSPTIHETRYLRAMAYLRSGRATETISLLDALDAAQAVNPAWLLTQRAQALMALRQFDAAEDVVRRYREVLVKSGQGEGRAAHLEATLALLRGQIERARVLVRRALADSSLAHVGMSARSRSQWALGLLCSIELSSRQPRAARRVLMLLDPTQSDQSYAMEWARLCMIEGKLEEATAFYARAEATGAYALQSSLSHAHELAPSELLELQRRLARLRNAPSAPPATPAVPPATGASLPQLPMARLTEAPPTIAFVGNSLFACRVRETIAILAPLDAPVLITGETGTGKEIAANLLHTLGPRKAEPFVAVNCAGLSDTLIESELFGHVRGAFTGATEARVGLFEAAKGGTLYLDEFHAISPRLQVVLLRALEGGEIRPVGANAVRKVRARVIVSASPALRQMVDDSAFRPDLYYRVARLRLDLPPLRDRLDDIPLLVQHFLDALYNRFEVALDESLLNALRRRQWHGNVRELRNEIERVVLLAGNSKLLTAEFLGSDPDLPRKNQIPPTAPGNQSTIVDDGLSVSPMPPAKGRHARRHTLLAIFDRLERVTQKDVVSLLQCAPNTARQDLHDLESEGRIVKVNPTSHPRTAFFVKSSAETLRPVCPPGRAG